MYTECFKRFKTLKNFPWVLLIVEISSYLNDKPFYQHNVLIVISQTFNAQGTSKYSLVSRIIFQIQR